MKEIDTSERVVIAKVWDRLRLSMFIQWDTLRAKVAVGRINQSKARSTFAVRFGSDWIAYHFDGDKVMVALSPP